MSKTSTIIAFAVGAAAGAVTSWLMTKSYYDKLVKEEIQSVKDTYKKKYKGYEGEHNPTEEDDSTEEAPESPRAAKLREYKERIAEFGYSDEEDDEKEETSHAEKPYVIPPEEFGEDENYDTETLTYFDDGVLADDFGNMIRDIESLVGEESLNRFGEYEDDAVHVKNDVAKTYFEILKDERTWHEYNQTRRTR